MRRYWLAIALVLFLMNISMGAQGTLPENKDIPGQNQITENSLPANYQQLKYRLLHLENKKNSFPAPSFQGQTNLTMLYVAGGLLVATSAFVFLNGYNNEQGYFSQANTGIIIGGGFSTVIFVTKFFVDQY